MIRITRDQAMQLNKQGFKFGEILHHTYSHHKSYYLTETPKALKALERLEQKSMPS